MSEEETVMTFRYLRKEIGHVGEKIIDSTINTMCKHLADLNFLNHSTYGILSMIVREIDWRISQLQDECYKLESIFNEPRDPNIDQDRLNLYHQAVKYQQQNKVDFISAYKAVGGSNG